MNNAFENITLDDLYEFLEYGKMDDAPEEITSYMIMLDNIWRMHKRGLDFPDNESIISHLTLVNGFKRSKARQLVHDALEYFGKDNQLSKDIWRGILAEKGLKSFTASIRVAKNSRDFKDSFWILIELGRFLGWDVPDVDKVDENFLRQMQIVSADIEMFGLPKVPRNEINTWIDALPEISDKMKEKAKADVDGVPFRLLKRDSYE